jgi:hypothetical protein
MINLRRGRLIELARIELIKISDNIDITPFIRKCQSKDNLSEE